MCIRGCFVRLWYAVFPSYTSYFLLASKSICINLFSAEQKTLTPSPPLPPTPGDGVPLARKLKLRSRHLPRSKSYQSFLPLPLKGQNTYSLGFAYFARCWELLISASVVFFLFFYLFFFPLLFPLQLPAKDCAHWALLVLQWRQSSDGCGLSAISDQ